ncbi:MAG: Hsp20 family protein [Pseudomonadota bacterium]
MSRIASLNHPLLLGFEDLEHALEKISQSSDSTYPPYNIERFIAENSEQGIIRITLAVAGFERHELEIHIENRQLIIQGNKQINHDIEYLHQGIAKRKFRKAFLLAERVENISAELENGLLSIELLQPEDESVLNTIEIN